MRITKATVDRLRPEEGRDLVAWDDVLPRFGVRVKPTGAKTYVLQYRNAHGASRRMALGRHGIVTAEQARRRAKALLAAVAKGDDPAQEKRERREEPTVARLAEMYLERHARVKKKPSSAARDDRNLRLHVLPALGRRPVSEVSRQHVAALHHSLRETPIGANRVLALVSALFTFAERMALRADGTNPARHVERFPERKRERFLSEVELGRMGAALAQAEQEGTEPPAAIAALRLLVLTGCRRGEILGLRWEDVDFAAGCLRLADSKTAARPVPMNAPARELLEALGPKDSGFVIHGVRAGQPFVGLHRVWDRIRSTAKLPAVRIHDLRHSFASVAAGSGQTLLLIGGLLGHRVPLTTARYAHLADDPLRAASEVTGGRIHAAMQRREGAKVLPLNGRTKSRRVQASPEPCLRAVRSAVSRSDLLATCRPASGRGMVGSRTAGS